MRLKLDENIHGDVRDALTQRGHDVATVHEERLGGHPDEDVAGAARDEDRCLVTFDLDLADPRIYPPGDYAGIIVLRLRVPTARMQVACIARFLEASPEVKGKLWILDETRARDWTPSRGAP